MRTVCLRGGESKQGQEGFALRRKLYKKVLIFLLRVLLPSGSSRLPGDQDFFPPFPWIDVSRKQGFWCTKYLDFLCKIVVFKVMISQF